jgi:hypothetical protein
MHELPEISQIIASMPLQGLVTIIMLAAFVLAGFAIYAVMTIAKGRSDGTS